MRSSDPGARRARGDPAAIARPLARWYRRHARELPWRGISDPYAIWLSEVMLQQTRVSTAIPYYRRFLERFPTVRDIAAAAEEEVLAEWAGLGYYSRGRALLRAARIIDSELRGEFPRELAAIRALPGIGEYTAAAIASIAFGTPVAVVDGNVERVLCRHGAIAGDPKRGAARSAVRGAAERALPRRSPGDHNQAMMELGATVCTPRAPRCDSCPLERSCASLALGVPEAFPPPRARRDPETQHWAALLVGDGERIWTVPRGAEEELLPGHRGVPLVRIAGEEPPDEGAIRAAAARALAAHDAPRGRAGGSDRLRDRANASAPAGEVLPAVRHSITHRRLWLHPVRLAGSLAGEGAETVRPGDAHRLPALFRKILAAVAPGDAPPPPPRSSTARERPS